MICSKCGEDLAINPTGGFLPCECAPRQLEVKTQSAPQGVAAEVHNRCPVCSGSLADVVIEGQAVRSCDGCKGVLVSMGTFLPLVELLRAKRDRPVEFLSPRSEPDADRRLPCPVCAQTMLTHPYGGPGNVNIESCEACSMIWLDQGELDRIASAADPKPVPVYSEYDEDRDADRSRWSRLF